MRSEVERKEGLGALPEILYKNPVGLIDSCEITRARILCMFIRQIPYALRSLECILLHNISHGLRNRVTMAVNINHEGYNRRMEVVKDVLRERGLFVNFLGVGFADIE